MRFVRIVSMVLILNIIFVMNVLANDNVEKEQIVASFSGALQICILQQGKLENTQNILNHEKWSNAYWPSYDKEKKTIYFSAKGNIKQGSPTSIYRISSLSRDQEPIKLIDNARYPSLSPDNKFLAFYRHPNQLWIYGFGDMKSQRTVGDIINYQPCVWVSNTHLLYIDLNNELVLLDVTKDEKQKTALKGIVPGVLSPDGKKVLCGSSDGLKIYFYYPSSNKLELIKKSKFRSIGTSFVWLSESDGFLFTMQTWSNILRFNESCDLFLYDISDKEETLLLDKIALFGGTTM